MDEKLLDLAAKFVLELSESTPEDYLQIKLMMLSHERQKKTKIFLERIFALAEQRRPLLLTAE